MLMSVHVNWSIVQNKILKRERYVLCAKIITLLLLKKLSILRIPTIFIASSQVCTTIFLPVILFILIWCSFQPFQVKTTSLASSKSIFIYFASETSLTRVWNVFFNLKHKQEMGPLTSRRKPQNFKSHSFSLSYVNVSIVFLYIGEVLKMCNVT